MEPLCHTWLCKENYDTEDDFDIGDGMDKETDPYDVDDSDVARDIERDIDITTDTDVNSDTDTDADVDNDADIDTDTDSGTDADIDIDMDLAMSSSLKRATVGWIGLP